MNVELLCLWLSLRSAHDGPELHSDSFRFNEFHRTFFAAVECGNGTRWNPSSRKLSLRRHSSLAFTEDMGHKRHAGFAAKIPIIENDILVTSLPKHTNSFVLFLGWNDEFL